MLSKGRIIAIVIITLILGVCLILNTPVSKTDVKDATTSTQVISQTTTLKKTTKKKAKKKKKKKVYKTYKKVKTASKETYYNYARQQGGYDDEQMSCLINLWNRESGWNPNSRNKSSGACGIPQAYPCSKIKKQQGSSGWKAQIRWGINYINYRYKSPCNAWKYWKKHHWY